MTSGNMSGHDAPVFDVNVTSFDREYLHWSFIILEVAAVVVIVIGDIFMLMMFFTRKLLGQSTNILVFSVAIGDLVTGLLALPLAMLQKILVDPSDFLCKGYFYFANVSKTAVGYTILLLAMERIIAVLMHAFRILPPGRCLFFASLTWFFAAAYNIWSVVIYDVEVVTTLAPDRRNKDLFLCFASSRFMYLHDIFEVLNPLVTFTFPALCSSLLFLYFLRNKHEADKPGRPYKSSKSVVIFTFALLVSFVASHLPWEIATLVLSHDAPEHQTRQLVSLKILHLLSFSRGFWDIFIFGAFRHYVCKKEKALAHFREQRSLHVQRSSLAIPMSDRPMSTSLLDSDPSVSRRYSSDISRRPSAYDDPHSCVVDHHDGQTNTDEEAANAPVEHNAPVEEKLIPVVRVGYLIPRSPCASDSTRYFFFPPCNESPIHFDDENCQTKLEKPKFGSCEIIHENFEASDSLGDLHSQPKRRGELRRKSCGDKVSHPKTLHLQLRAAKTLANSHAKFGPNPQQLNPRITTPELSEDDTFSDGDGSSVMKLKSVDRQNHDPALNSPKSDDEKGQKSSTFHSNHLQMQTSKSVDKISSPTSRRPSTLQAFQTEPRRNTLTVPSSIRRSSACNRLAVPGTITPYVPRSPCASD